jgi:hypothetical protein
MRAVPWSGNADGRMTAMRQPDKLSRAMKIGAAL